MKWMASFISCSFVLFLQTLIEDQSVPVQQVWVRFILGHRSLPRCNRRSLQDLSTAPHEAVPRTRCKTIPSEKKPTFIFKHGHFTTRACVKNNSRSSAPL